tara:strand:+ start:14245 stop:17121 length:2877 start_codon:yes stop_codon:yes gene_type:complete
MSQTETLHMFDTELEALCRRGYQGGHPIELILDGYLFEENGNYFHTVDGRFAKIWKINGFDASVLNNDDLFGCSGALGEALNKYPEGSCGQFIRHNHRDIRGIMENYVAGLRDDNNEFETAIADSILERQYSAAIAPNGFFAKISSDLINRVRTDAMEQAGDLDDDVRDNLSNAIQREINEGRYPYVSDFYLIFHWEPSYIFGKFLDNTVKSALASVGLADANQQAFNAYTKHAKRFGEHANDIAQALANSNFAPEELNGQGYINLVYQILNPVRSFTIEPPRYRNDVPIYECLNDPTLTPQYQSLNSAASFAEIYTSSKGWRIHDSGHDYYCRPVSILGKPAKSAPGMLQTKMAGLETESLITLNWQVPSSFTVTARTIARKKLLDAKQTMRLGDKETRNLQEEDLEAVKRKLSSENVTGREITFDTALHVCLMGFDEGKLQDIASQLENRLWRIGKAENLRGDAVARTALPLNFVPSSRTLLRRDTPHLTESLSHLCPIFIEYQGVPDAGIMMNNRSGQPIYLDLWGSLVITAHSLIVGTTGSGKSFIFNNILMALQVKYRPKVWIIDKGDSYESLCLVQGGNYIRLATEPFEDPVSEKMVYPICINPFYIPRDEEGTSKMPALDDMMFLADMMVMMMTVGSGEKNAYVHPKTRSLLYKALVDFYQDWIVQNPMEEPIMSNFMPVLSRTNFTDLLGKDLVERLTLFYGSGPYAALCDGKLQVDWDNDFTVLETQRMAKSDALGVITLALFRQIDMYCKFKLSKEQKKIIAVDEAWATLSSPAAASALAAFYREMRKYNAGCLLISQTVKDFVNILKAESSGATDSQDGILENTSHYFFLSCSESDYSIAESELGFSEEEVDLWKSLASLPPIYSEVFYRMRTTQGLYYSGVVRLFASSVCLWIASSSPDDYAIRERRTLQIMNNDSIDENGARQRAVVQLAKEYPYGAKYHVKDAS